MRVLVTGGGGFLGSHIAQRLVERGDSVRVLGRRAYPGLDKRIETVQADIRDADAVSRACRERDAVFHAAAVPGVWGGREEFFSINVEGTRNLIGACRKNSVEKLIFTSSPSVILTTSDAENVDESMPYPESWLCDYPHTKALAEQMVMQANGTEGLLTVSLRPHLIWGPGDPHLMPRILRQARNGKLVRVGSGENLVDIIYIDNAVEAHLLACDALQAGSPPAGQTYFVSDGEPVNLWNWIGGLLEQLNLPPVTRSISYRTAYLLGFGMEWGYRLLRLQGEPRMTRFIAAQLATSHYFDITRARRDFGYRPVVEPAEGLRRLIRSLLPRRED